MAVILFNNDDMKAMFSKGTCIGNQRNVQTVAKAYATTNDLQIRRHRHHRLGLPIATAHLSRRRDTASARSASGVRYYPHTVRTAHVASSLANW